MEKIEIDLSELYKDTAKLSELGGYMEKVKEIAGNGNRIILTGKAPIWLYLKAAHELHGKAKSLFYDSPVTGEVEVFNHNPF